MFISQSNIDEASSRLSRQRPEVDPACDNWPVERYYFHSVHVKYIFNLPIQLELKTKLLDLYYIMYQFKRGVI